MDKLVINDVEYVKASEVQAVSLPAEELDGKKYCIIRTYSAGVFAGNVTSSGWV